jgi:hypothetical protein
MKKLLLITIFFLSATSCKTKVIDIKSPCVSLDDGPCGPKKSVNDWWLKDKKNNKNS